MLNTPKKSNEGFIALTLVLVIGAVLMGVATSVSLLAIGEAQLGLSNSKGELSWNLVDGCAEDALQKIHDVSGWSGGTLIRPEGSCLVTINSGNPDWDITVTSLNSDYPRSVRIKATRGTTIAVTSWLEI